MLFNPEPSLAGKQAPTPVQNQLNLEENQDQDYGYEDAGVSQSAFGDAKRLTKRRHKKVKKVKKGKGKNFMVSQV